METNKKSSALSCYHYLYVFGVAALIVFFYLQDCLLGKMLFSFILTSVVTLYLSFRWGASRHLLKKDPAEISLSPRNRMSLTLGLISVFLVDGIMLLSIYMHLLEKQLI